MVAFNVGLGRCLCLCRHQVSLVCLFPERFRITAGRTANQYAGGNGADGSIVYSDWYCSGTAISIVALHCRLCAVYCRSCIATTAFITLRRAGLFYHAAMDKKYAYQHKRFRLDLQKGPVCFLAGCNPGCSTTL